MSCIPVTAEYLLSRTWTHEMIADGIYNLAREECPTYEVDMARMVEAVKNPNIKRYFLFDPQLNKMTGYFTVWNLSLNYRDKVINGTFADGELLKGVVPMIGEVYLYIAGFVISKNYRSDHSNFKKILVVFVEFLTQLMRDGVIINEMTARGLTPMGQQLCEGLGMTKILNHREKGIIYGVSFDWKEKPKYGSVLYDAVQKTKAKRLLNQLLGMDEKTGLPLVKQALSNWGYSVDGV
jgi:hypothetical protein